MGAVQESQTTSLGQCQRQGEPWSRARSGAEQQRNADPEPGNIQNTGRCAQQCQATEVAPSGFSGQAARQPPLLQPGENALPDGGGGHGA